MAHAAAPIADRFWPKVEKTDGCWNWTASLQSRGYGQIGRGTEPGIYLAHRVAYELEVGPIPEGMFLDHTCFNRRCVNPSHLRLVTNKQNMENPSGLASNNTSGARGVTWAKHMNKWHAQVHQNGKTHHAGYFHSFEEAKETARELRNKLFTHNDADRTAA